MDCSIGWDVGQVGKQVKQQWVLQPRMRFPSGCGVSMPGPGSGRGNRYNPGRRCLDRENKKKRCVITIKNRDALCCARAIVTMRVHCHKGEGSEGHGQWENLKRGYPVQQRQAQELHHQAGIDLGPCGLEELQQFQHALGPQYQLLVMNRMKRFFLIFKGSTALH